MNDNPEQAWHHLKVVTATVDQQIRNLEGNNKDTSSSMTATSSRASFARLKPSIDLIGIANGKLHKSGTAIRDPILILISNYMYI